MENNKNIELEVSTIIEVEDMVENDKINEAIVELDNIVASENIENETLLQDDETICENDKLLKNLLNVKQVA